MSKKYRRLVPSEERLKNKAEAFRRSGLTRNVNIKVDAEMAASILEWTGCITLRAAMELILIKNQQERGNLKKGEEKNEQE